jgi:hypothetical protein
MPDEWVTPDESHEVPYPTWPASTTVGEVAQYACESLGPLILCFVAAARRKDSTEMAVHLKALRHVITRMDQFRRMKEKQWADALASNPKWEENDK